MKKSNKKGEGTFARYTFPGGVKGYRYFRTISGKKYSVTGINREECYVKMREKIYSSENPEDKANMLVINLIDEYLDYKESLKGRLALKAKTIADYREQVDTHIRGTKVANTPISTLTGRDLMQLFSELKKKPGRPKSGMSVNDPNRPKISDSYVVKIYNIFTGAFEYAINIAEYTNRNPAVKIKKEVYDCYGAPEKEIITLSDFQVEKLLSTIEQLKYKDKVMYYTLGLPAIILLFSGIRVSEVAALLWSDYIKTDDGRRYIKVNKQRKYVKYYDAKAKKAKTKIEVLSTTKERKNNNIEVTKTVISAIEELKNYDPFISGDQYIIRNPQRKPSSGDYLSKNINKLYDAAGIRSEIVSGAHILRRTFATRWYHAGISIDIIANNIGDEPDTVWKYYIDTKAKNTLNGTMLTVVNKPENLPENLR